LYQLPIPAIDRPLRALRLLVLTLLLSAGATGGLSAGAPGVADAHQSGCHRWHSCPSDSGSYVCGDLGYYTYCPGGDPNAPPPPPPPPASAPPADGDADGVPDASDTCPTVGAATADGCPAPAAQPTPPADRDQDGVADVSDECPDTSGTSASGCLPDGDGDGMPDAQDLCPTKADERGDGCPRGQRIRARIISVVDGDTIKVLVGKRKRTIRLIGVDTPESVKPGTPVECGANAGAAFLRRLSFKRGKGRFVTLTTDPTQDRYDRYGRLLAYAKVDNGRVLQAELLRAGWATVYVYEKKFERFGEFTGLATKAFFAKRGVWGQCAGNFHQS
jgi:micrococcal nuclease